MMKKVLFASLIAVVLMFASCTEDNRYSTDYVCNFMFRGDYHTESILASVLKNSGIYVNVKVQKKLGLTNLVVKANSGKEEEILLQTEIENRFDYSNVGANQCIFIGCTVTNEWRAYDGQCPYCLENKSGYDHPLSWTDNIYEVKCAKCNRTYNLNYEGISDDGYRMLQYNVRSTEVGTGSIITVTNG